MISTAKLISDDLHLVYLTSDEKTVIKLFLEDRSEDNNEFEVLERLQLIDTTFPKPLFQKRLNCQESEKLVELLKLDEETVIYKMIAYEYIVGEDMSKSKLSVAEQYA